MAGPDLRITVLAPAGISQPDPLGIGFFLKVVAVLTLQQVAER